MRLRGVDADGIRKHMLVMRDGKVWEVIESYVEQERGCQNVCCYIPPRYHLYFEDLEGIKDQEEYSPDEELEVITTRDYDDIDE